MMMMIMISLAVEFACRKTGGNNLTYKTFLLYRY